MQSKLVRKTIIIGFPILAMLAVLWAVFVRQPLPCALYMTTGLYCPTCGATRAVISIFRGDIVQALRCNLVVTLLFLPAASGAVWFYISVLTDKALQFSRRSLRTAIIILTIFIVFGIVRNIRIEPFTLLVP